jgi:hypothetical protein
MRSISRLALPSILRHKVPEPSPLGKVDFAEQKTDEVAKKNFIETSSTTPWSPFPKGEGQKPLRLFSIYFSINIRFFQ